MYHCALQTYRSHSYLLYSSSHPSHVKNSIPYYQGHPTTNLLKNVLLYPRCFQYCWEKNYLFLFASKTHKKFPSQEDKIGWFPSQPQSEQPASRTTKILYNVRQNGRGKRSQIEPSVVGGGGGGTHLTFQNFTT